MTLAEARRLAPEILRGGSGQADLPYLFETLAAINGLPLLSRILERFSKDEFDFRAANVVRCSMCRLRMFRF